MLNQDKLLQIIEEYKEYFPKHWKDEKFKWEAVKHFQEHWDINALDFKTMLSESLEKTNGLLSSGFFFAKGMIELFAEEDPEATRAAFITLFDESKDLQERVSAFQAFAEDRKENHNTGWKNHYQNTYTISIYLWLKYPDKYYIYKYSEMVVIAKELESDFRPKRNSDPAVLMGGFKMFDEMRDILAQDIDLKEMFQNAITDKCYSDPQLHTLTFDVGFFISRYFAQKKDAESGWWPSKEEYDPGFTVEEWAALLNDKTIFSMSSLEIMKRFKDYGGQATCTQLAVKYGGSKNLYNSGSSTLAERIAKKTGCPVPPDREPSGNARWWPVLYVGKNADKNTEGSYIYKLRDELSQALNQIDLSAVPLYVENTNEEEHRYWWLNANPKIWSFSDIAVGETQEYSLYNENGNKRRIFQNFLDAKAGDIIIGYESNPVKQIVALGEILQENDGEVLPFTKTEGLSIPIDYAQLKSAPELEKMEYFTNSQGSLFKLTPGEYELIMDIIREVNPITDTTAIESYSKEDFLSQVYMSEERFDTLTALLKNKKNIILQGAPGVGKTFTAKKLAYAMMGKRDDSRVELIQFHQNYSYEDFIQGYKPVDDGFKLTNGVFYQFCQNAANHPDEDYFFIIDEINRGNLSKIFGELLMLIEKDYRGTKATLAYSGTSFTVPENLYIIGMMNTADRSLALIDYALRRRFSFFEMEPGFNSEGFKNYQAGLNNETFDTLVERVKELNKEINLDDSLGAGFRIGHSYFCGQKECTEEWMREVVHYDLLPMLQEYWFDDKQKLQRWENILTGVFND